MFVLILSGVYVVVLLRSGDKKLVEFFLKVVVFNWVFVVDLLVGINFENLLFGDFCVFDDVGFKVDCIVGLIVLCLLLMFYNECLGEDGYVGVIVWCLINILVMNYMGLIYDVVGKDGWFFCDILSVFVLLFDNVFDCQVQLVFVVLICLVIWCLQ